MPRDYCSPESRVQLLSSSDDYPYWDALVLRKLKPDPIKAVVLSPARQPPLHCELLPHVRGRWESREGGKGFGISPISSESLSQLAVVSLIIQYY